MSRRGIAGALCMGVMLLPLSLVARSRAPPQPQTLAVTDTIGGPGAPLAKRVVVGMDTNINAHAAWNDWPAWRNEMEPYWTQDMIYDFAYVGQWGFGPTHGLRGWYDGEHMHYNGALP